MCNIAPPSSLLLEITNLDGVVYVLSIVPPNPSGYLVVLFPLAPPSHISPPLFLQYQDIFSFAKEATTVNNLQRGYVNQAR